MKVDVGTLLTCDNMRDGLVHATRQVKNYGSHASPRDMPTLELLNFGLTLTKPWDSVPTGIRRPRLNPSIGFAEGLQLVAGESHPKLLARIAPTFERFMEPDGSLHGAYGPRVMHYIRRVIRLLARDPDSRQAVVNIFDVALDLHQGDNAPKDIPCTIALHFMLRNGKLILITRMRSNDVWLGLPYDVMQFTLLQIAMANALDVEPGIYYHSSNSMHLYDRDLAAASELRYVSSYEEHEQHLRDWGMWTGVGARGMSWEEIQHRARVLLGGSRPKDPTPTEELMHRELARYV